SAWPSRRPSGEAHDPRQPGSTRPPDDPAKRKDSFVDDIIVFVGARGGQGTSTVAATAALQAAQHSPTSLLCVDPLSTAALLGAPPVLPGEQAEIAPGLTLTDLDGPRRAVTVIDAGSLTTTPAPPAGSRTILVIRGPSYLALHTAIGHPDLHPDGAVIVAEPGRALSDLDVTEILAIPVLASVPVRADIARTVDAGLLLTEATSRPSLRPIHALVDGLLPDVARRREIDLRQPALHRAGQELTVLDGEVGW